MPKEVVKKTGPFLIPIADPLADEKMTKKVLKLAKKASKRKQTKRGTKEVVKGIRKGLKGCAASCLPCLVERLPGWLHNVQGDGEDPSASFAAAKLQTCVQYAYQPNVLQDLHPGWRHLTNRCHHPHPCALRGKPDSIHLRPIQGGKSSISTPVGMIRCSTLFARDACQAGCEFGAALICSQMPYMRCGAS